MIDFKKLMNKEVSAETLQVQSKSVLSVFQQTIDDLVEINEVAEKEIISKNEMIKAAQQEVTSLEELSSKNNTVISKINSIFN